MQGSIEFIDVNDQPVIANLSQLTYAEYQEKGDQVAGRVLLCFDKGRAVTVKHGAESLRVWNRLQAAASTPDR